MAEDLVPQNVGLRAILSNPNAARELSPGLYTAFPEETGAPYDRRAVAYDAIVGRSIYHRAFWGTSALAYARFARAALEAADDGHFAEVGCGSLLFTGQMYVDSSRPWVTLVDRSLSMLRRGLQRLSSAREAPPERIAVLHADAAALPVRSGVFSTILTLNVLHVPCDRTGIIAECARTLLPGRGRLFVSSLVRAGRWSDAYLSVLHRAGELGPPLTIDHLRETVAGSWAVIESTSMEGNMCFLVVRHAG